MFAQVISGQVSDAEAMHDAMERWVSDLAPGAEGWLGCTSGVTADGRFLSVVRFESEEAARRNSDRPEQGQWWESTSQLFTGDATFRDSDDLILDVVGDPDAAGFVQFMQGTGEESERARELMTQHSDEWAAFRPDILGSVVVLHGGGDYTMALYCTSEADARVGEKKEPPPEIRAQMEEMDALSSDDVPDFFDITDPWIYSPR